MIKAPTPIFEDERHRALLELKILDTSPEERFDRITRTAKSLFNVEMSYVALVDSSRQWFKSKCGIKDTETPRDTSFCGHAIVVDKVLVIPDATTDERFHDNPMVVGNPFVRFYAGRPLKSISGYNVGTLCVAGCQPRSVSDNELGILNDLASIVEDQLNLMEISKLQSDLTAAHSELRAKSDFIQSVFGQYAGNQLLEKVLSQPQSIRIGGESRNVSVLVSDLRGFTELSSKTSPAELVGMLNLYFERMIDVINEFSGMIIDFVGDGILAVFGALSPYENHAERAMACSRKMQQELQKLKNISREVRSCDLQMGIGVNSGDAVVGNIGSSKRLKFGVVGATVNLAARIESFTVGGQILVSTHTLEAASVPFRTVGNLRVNIKGIDSPFTIHELAITDSEA